MRYESGRELLEAVKSGTLQKSIVIVGAVKKSDDDPNAILFSSMGNCEHWFLLPVDLIGEAQFIGDVPCGDHRHTIVSLTLNEPDPKNAQATVFAAILRSLGRNQARVSRPSLAAGHSELTPRVGPAARRFGACFDAIAGYAVAKVRWILAGKPGPESPEWWEVADEATHMDIVCGNFP